MTIAELPPHLDPVMHPFNIFNILWSFIGAICIAGGLVKEFGPWAVLLFFPIVLVFLLIDLANAHFLSRIEAKKKVDSKK